MNVVLNLEGISVMRVCEIKIVRLILYGSPCKQLQIERSLGIEFDTAIHKRLAINLLLRIGQKGPIPM